MCFPRRRAWSREGFCVRGGGSLDSDVGGASMDRRKGEREGE